MQSRETHFLYEEDDGDQNACIDQDREHKTVFRSSGLICQPHVVSSLIHPIPLSQNLVHE